MKKKIALLLCSTGNEAFAVGNVIIGAKKYLFQNLKDEEYDVVFYTNKLETNKATLLLTNGTEEEYFFEDGIKNLLKIKEIPTMNMLPALFVPPIWFALVSLVSSLGIL